MGKISNEKRRDAFGADMLRIHPSWSITDIQFAWQMMPTSNAVFHPPGTVAHVAERERHERSMTVFITHVMNPEAAPFTQGSHWEGETIVLTPRATGSLNGSGQSKRKSAPLTDPAGQLKPNPYDGDKAQPVGKMVKAGSKKAAVAEMVRRANGCTVDDICTELGIGAVAARGLLSDCRKAGVNIKREGDRYVGE